MLNPLKKKKKKNETKKAGLQKSGFKPENPSTHSHTHTPGVLELDSCTNNQTSSQPSIHPEKQQQRKPVQTTNKNLVTYR